MSKRLDRLTLLQTFVRIADAGSISAAARDLGVSQPSASRQLAELEERMSVQLMRRNTHSLALTDAGVEFLADARSLLEDWNTLVEKHQTAQNRVAGKLKVVVPVALGQTHLTHIAFEFQRDYPEVSLTWLLEDHSIRFAEVGCDCWIKIGRIPDETLVVQPLGAVERLLVAAPQCIATSFENPEALADRPLLALEPFEGGVLPLDDAKGQTRRLKPKVRLTTNNIFALRQAVLTGLGMAILPKWLIQEQLDQGLLIDLLPTWRAPKLRIHAAYLPGKRQPQRLRVFLERVVQGIAATPGIQTI